ncbi:HD domain-containing phosphohydrolase [Thioalkalivibrio thiocyanodenitrificans]|uniref:HD domain-containing phosphohydrolase n=1 Tax=Thioalkalivibrio thiocyanodenitrificans TaxID=243063 RepID=UPI000362BD9B|nr:HD domain-containing phosphohydrolase [Thioalkalivibrio thiocyanodenitrificans]
MGDEGQGGPRAGLGGRRHLPVILVLCAGILLSLAVFWLLRSEDRSLHDAFYALWAGLLVTAFLGVVVAFRERGLARIEQAHREWLDAFDAVRHPIFLHDRKGRLLRANRAYAERAGLDYRQLIGRRYWEVFPPGDQPLPRCRLELEAEDGAHHEGESSGEALDEVVLESGEIFLSRAFAVRDDAGRYRYSIHAMEDITEQRRAQESLWRHVELQDIVRNISTRFLKLGAHGTDEGIDAALRELGNHVGADRCYLFQFSEDGTRMDNTHEWCAEGIAAQMPSLRGLPTAGFGWSLERLRSFKPVAVPRVSDVPPASPERAHFEAGEVQSLLLVPVVLGERLMGFIGSDRVRTERGWDDFDLRLLQDAAAAIAYALAQRDTERAVQRLDRVLITLSHANAALVHADHEDELLRRICDVIVSDGGFRAAWVGYGTPDGGLNMRACAGDCCAAIEAMATRWSGNETAQCPCGKALHSGRTQVFNEIPEDVQSAPWGEDLRSCGIGSTAALALFADGELFGSLNVHADEPGVFTEAVVDQLEELARDLSYGLGALRIKAERDEAHGALGKTLLQTVEAVARVVEMHDPYTSGHQRRVADLASSIAAELGLDAHRIEGVRVGAQLHDIGKIAVPAEILTRPGRLSDMEYGLIKGHAQTGYDILKDVSFPWPVREMILQHHERLDGSGYPFGLKGGQIVLEARILAVADVVEAMTTHRPYRAGLGIDQALTEIEQGRGHLYDPAAVDACLRLFREKGFQWE